MCEPMNPAPPVTKILRGEGVEDCAAIVHGRLTISNCEAKGIMQENFPVLKIELFFVFVFVNYIFFQEERTNHYSIVSFLFIGNNQTPFDYFTKSDLAKHKILAHTT